MISLIQEKKNIVAYSLIFFLAVSCMYLVGSVFLQLHTNTVKQEELVKNEKRLVSVESHVLSNKIKALNSDLLYITDTLNQHQFNNNSLNEIENEWISFADRKKIYDQIRYIDINGDEKIRINYYEDGSKLVNKEGLQNKKDRYYFTDTIKLSKNQIYISKLDLNIENGKIEQPIKPMIRLSTPVYNDREELLGIVILNYYAEYLIDDFKSVAATSVGTVFLLDANGYWIVNDIDENKEWTFMYDDKKNISFNKQYPYEWNEINKNQSGKIKTENGYFIYTNIIPVTTENTFGIDNNIILGEGNWMAVSFLSENSKYTEILFTSIDKVIYNTLKNQWINFIFIFLISILFAVLMTLNKMAKNRIKYFSEYDTMTGVYNRRAGYELLSKSYRQITKDSGAITVCFIDINGLKDVNDNLGHEAGDELIMSIVSGIKKCIRESDYIIRLGGDEFLIVFMNMREEQAEIVWGRINDEYKKINENEERKYLISASHGVAEFTFDSNEYIDSIINLADEKMYNEKRIIKKDLEILKKN